MTLQRFRVKDTDANREIGLQAGLTVQAYEGYDYGLRRDNEAVSNKPYTNVTPDGLEPFFCVPTEGLEPIEG